MTNNCPYEATMTKLMENVFEISRIAECLVIDGTIQVDDSRELFHCVKNWANEFEASFHDNGKHDYLIAIEEYAANMLLNTFPPTEETKSQHPAIQYTLPTGVVIRAEVAKDTNAGPHGKLNWMTIDIVVEHPDGSSRSICAVDFEKAGALFPEDTIRVLAYDAMQEDPVYENLLNHDDILQFSKRWKKLRKDG